MQKSFVYDFSCSRIVHLERLNSQLGPLSVDSNRLRITRGERRPRKMSNLNEAKRTTRANAKTSKKLDMNGLIHYVEFFIRADAVAFSSTRTYFVRAPYNIFDFENNEYQHSRWMNYSQLNDSPHAIFLITRMLRSLFRPLESFPRLSATIPHSVLKIDG